MNEKQVIEFVDSLDVFQKATIYMNYYVNMLYSKYTSDYYKERGFDNWKPNNYEQFTDKSNVQYNSANCDNWEERGFASKDWINFQAGSIYHYVYHSIN